MESDNILKGARIYLSGPMDFVASQKEEKRHGWRVRIREFLKNSGAIVYDPWAKPLIVGQNSYGKDYEYTGDKRAEWTFEDSEKGSRIRAQLCQFFYPTVHINHRLVDICDFLIAYCPTNIYSVGTVNEIVRAREQHKPVLFVSPPVIYTALDDLSIHLEQNQDQKGLELLSELRKQAALKANPEGIPSPWYLALMNGDYFFDGFGFSNYGNRFNWTTSKSDQSELLTPPKRPLLPYLEELNKQVPKRFDVLHNECVENADWMILQPGAYESDSN